MQKQSNVRSLLHSVNQALGEHTRALLEVDATSTQLSYRLLQGALDLVEKRLFRWPVSAIWSGYLLDKSFLNTRLTLIEAASQVHLSKTEIETLTGLALKASQMHHCKNG